MPLHLFANKPLCKYTVQVKNIIHPHTVTLPSANRSRSLTFVKFTALKHQPNRHARFAMNKFGLGFRTGLRIEFKAINYTQAPLNIIGLCFVGFSVVILKPKLLKDESKSVADDVVEDVQLLKLAASHRLYGTVLVRQSHKKIVRAKTKVCPEDAKKSDSEEFFSSHRFIAEDGPTPDFNVSK